MTLERISLIRRRFFLDLALLAGMAALVGAEIASVASATQTLSEQSGLAIDARGDEPAGLAIGDGAERLQDGRLARGDAANAANHTL